MAKTLIAYFSRADENYFGGAMRYVKVGNTEIVVGVMKDLIEADTFKIEMKDPYSPVYMTCIEEAKKDLLFTFLEAFDFSGKTILPLCTNEGSGMGGSERDIKKACPGADVKKGLPVTGSQAADSKANVEKWLSANGLL